MKGLNKETSKVAIGSGISEQEGLSILSLLAFILFQQDNTSALMNHLKYLSLKTERIYCNYKKISQQNPTLSS